MHNAEHHRQNILWYRQPASKFEEALPLGNGRLGAMVYGGVAQERLSLNEDTLWAGGPYDPVSPEAMAALPEVRRLVFAGRFEEAQTLAQATMMARPLKQMPYQVAGDLILDFADQDEASEYHRELDLLTATANVRFHQGDSHFIREVFASPVHQVIALRLTSSRPGGLNFTSSLRSLMPGTANSATGTTLLLTGQGSDSHGIRGQLKFAIRVHATVDGGQVQSLNETLAISRANSVTLLIAIATSYRRYDDVSGEPLELTSRAIAEASDLSFEQLRDSHVSEHQRLFNRVAIDLGSTSAALLPTDERVGRSSTLEDPALAALYLQFGRYLLISSSRSGTQPANLQGIWNELIDPPWDSKWTVNINTQMNYWPAETANLAELHEPLFRLIEEIAETGAKTARNMYGARGWVCHHNTDLWRATAPIDGVFWGMWPTGGAWLVTHLWEHYLFNPDVAFLKRVYPLMRGASEFFLDTLVEHPTRGCLVTCPSISPENAHAPGFSIAAGPAMDSQIIRDLFNVTIAAAGIVGEDATLATQLSATADRLPPHQIGAQGQLQEWLDDWDADAPEQEHRHISHLYALFPSAQINPLGTPDLAKACKVTLNRRGDLTTGWAIAWRINCWARLHDGNRAHKILRLLFDPSRTEPNLFDSHPPFQIDGNFGGASGIIEMLLQSHAGELHLLPALPAAWPNGKVTGLRARGGFDVDLAWEKSQLAFADIQARLDGTCRVRLKDKVVSISVRAGQSVRLRGTELET